MTSKLKTDVLETVSGSGTIALTNQLSGMTGASMPSGSVLQVVSYLTSTQVAQTGSTTDQILNSMTKTVTAIGANSKFLVQVRWFGEAKDMWDNCFNIHLNGTRVNSSGGRGHSLSSGTQSYGATVDDASTPEPMSFSTLVTTTAGVGSSLVFSLVFDSSNTYVIYSNRTFSTGQTNYEQGTSEIIITEIKG